MLHPNLQEPIMRHLLQVKLRLEDQQGLFLCNVFHHMVYGIPSQPTNNHHLLPGRQRRVKPHGDNRAFLRDLVLLSGPNDTVVPQQGARVLLSENGHIINGCQFTKSMSAAEVETRIMEVFDGKIPNLVDIELLMSVHNALVIPNLTPDQKGIDGVIVHRLFKNKPVYIRPSCELLNFTQRQMRQSETWV